jgi:endonuclease III
MDKVPNEGKKMADQVIWIVDRLLATFPEEAAIQTRSVLDELIFNVLVQGSSKDRALEAFNALKEEYYDWNEARVTKPASIAEIIKGVGLESLKATRLVKILQGIFEDRSEVDLEFLQEMTIPAIRNYLGGMEGIGESSIDTVLTFSLGKSFFPLNKAAVRFGQRFGLISSLKEGRRLKGLLEGAVPQDKMPAFVQTLEFHNESICRSDKPKCKSCPFLPRCAFGGKKGKQSKEPK